MSLAIDVLHNIWVFQILHNFQLAVKLEIEYAILDEPSLVELFRGVKSTIVFGLYTVDCCKGTFA